MRRFGRTLTHAAARKAQAQSALGMVTSTSPSSRHPLVPAIFRLRDVQAGCVTAKPARETLELRAELVAMRAEMDTMRSEMADMRSENAALKEANAALREDNAELKRENAELKRKNDRLERDNVKLTREVGKLFDEVTALRSDNATLKADVATLRARTATLEDDNLRLKTKLSTERAEARQEAREQAVRIRLLELEIEGLKTSAQAEHEASSRREAALQAQVGGLERELKGARERILDDSPLSRYPRLYVNTIAHCTPAPPPAAQDLSYLRSATRFGISPPCPRGRLLSLRVLSSEWTAARAPSRSFGR